MLRRLVVLLIVLAMAAALAMAAWRATLHHFGGAWTHAPEDADWVLPARAKSLVAAAFQGPKGQAVVDHRVAVVSRGQLSGPHFVNHSREAGAVDQVPGPLAWLRVRLRDEAAGMGEGRHADAEYVSRLLRQIRAMPGDYRACLYARDAVYDSNGQRQPQADSDVVTNRYMMWLAGQAPKRLAPVASVNPNRPDASAALQRWIKAGATRVSWWPVAQRIDPSSAQAQALYPLMAAHHITLQVVVGAQTAGDRSGWTAPTALVPALAAGVRVELSLAGARGAAGQQLMPGLFALLDNPAYRRQLSVDTAGVLSGKAPETVLLPLLQHPQFFDRLHYASGYPTPAVAAAINLDRLVNEGFIGADKRAPLRAIYDVNPLLFAFVTLRNVHLPETALALPATVFFEPVKHWGGGSS